MPDINFFKKTYFNRLNVLDLDLIIAHVLKKPHEFVLAHPEFKITKKQEEIIKKCVNRRVNREPIAYLTGQKEFFGLNFNVNKHTLIPRPETELLIEETLRLHPKNTTIMDIGTGSGNIIISLAKNLKNKNGFIGIDISGKALGIAKQNAKKHKVNKKIKFIQGDLLQPIIGNWKPACRRGRLEIGNSKIIILANLPYLSQKIYSEISEDVKNFEPKSALFAKNEGLYYYEKLFQQIKQICCSLFTVHCSLFLEISPEQKSKISKIIKKYFPNFFIEFKKDLAGKWRVVIIKIG